jgi:hypothetical protein
LGSGRVDDAVADAGLTLEYVTKAYLVTRHPLLVISSDHGRIDLEGMSWALGAASTPPPGRTVSVTEAVRRCEALVPEIRTFDARTVIGARNGVLHAGSMATADADRVVADVAGICNILLPHIGHNSSGLWGHFQAAVFARLSMRRDETETRVRDLLAAAANRWEVDFKRRGIDWLNAIRRSSALDLREDETTVSCPACPGSAVVRGEIEYDEVPDYDQDGVVGVTRVPWRLHAGALRCSECALRLNGSNELAAAGVATTLELLDEGSDPAPY